MIGCWTLFLLIPSNGQHFDFSNLRLVQTLYFSLAELNSNLDRPKLTKVRLLIQTSNLISRSKAIPNVVPGRLINSAGGFQNIYIILIYALSSAHEKLGVWIKPIPKSKSWPSQAGRMAEPFQIKIAVPNWFRCRTFHVLNSMNYNVGSAHE